MTMKRQGIYMAICGFSLVVMIMIWCYLGPDIKRMIREKQRAMINITTDYRGK